MTFYDVFVIECQKKGVKPSKAASDCGINRSNVTNWKNNGYTPRGDALHRIADYFGVSVDYLLGSVKKEAPPETQERRLNPDNIMFALSRGGEKEITEDMFQEVVSFAEYIAAREDAKKKN